MREKNTLFSAAVILLVLCSPVFAYQQVIDLGALSGYQCSRAQSINDNGQIVGYVYKSNYPFYHRACLFDSTGGGANTNLGTLGGSQSNAYSINNNGKIVGQAQEGPPFDNVYYACLFDSTGGGSNESIGGSIASCINNNGYIAGQTYVGLVGHACLWYQTSYGISVYDLGTLGGAKSYAYSINNSIKVVGWAEPDLSSLPIGQPFYYHACLFDTPHGTHNIDLGTLGGDYSIAYSINDSGLIVGRADYRTDYTPSLQSYYHACIFDASGDGDNIDLGTLGGLASAALFANNENQIVGSAYDSSGNLKACLFDSTGHGNNVDLNTLIDPSSGWILKEADCINNNGWIVGYGTYNGIEQAFLLTPEPASALLLVIGAALLRRKK